MRTTGWKAAAAVLALGTLVCAAAFGQQGRGRGGFMRGGAGLLMRPEVQTELKLTETQKTQVQEMLDKLREERRGRFQELRDATPEERQKMIAEWQTEEAKRVNAILTTDQQKRFKQITLQQQGEIALAMPSVAEELKLTEVQKTKVQEVMRAHMEAQREIFQNAQGDFASAREKLEALRKETNTKLAAILTDEQKRQWKEMLGPEFRLDLIRA